MTSPPPFPRTQALTAFQRRRPVAGAATAGSPEERAEVAAHLHDSVLQTLALIQRAEDPRMMASIARTQERESPVLRNSNSRAATNRPAWPPTAAWSDLAILEDDYDSEYRHADRPLEPLQRMDQDGRVVYLGTFSKCLSPSLRLGFAVIPDNLVGAVQELRQAIDWQPATVLQTALHRFITEGSLDRHLRRTRRVYTDRYRIVRQFVHRHPALFEAIPSNAGLHFTALLGERIDDVDVVNLARQRGIAVEALSRYRLSPEGANGLLIGFGTINAGNLPEALELLADTVRDLANRPRIPAVRVIDSSTGTATPLIVTGDIGEPTDPLFNPLTLLRAGAEVRRSDRWSWFV